MDDSILRSTKKALGIDPQQIEFDPEIILHINSIFAKLNDLGIGPEGGYFIEDDGPTWGHYLNDDIRFNYVRTYMQQEVRLLWDPPTNSRLVDAIVASIAQFEWRLQTMREYTKYGTKDLSPAPAPTPDPSDGVYDGGNPGSSSDNIYDGGSPDGVIPGGSSGGTTYDGGTPTSVGSGNSNNSGSGSGSSDNSNNDTVYDGGAP